MKMTDCAQREDSGGTGVPQPNCYPPPRHRTYLTYGRMLFCCPASNKISCRPF